MTGNGYKYPQAVLAPFEALIGFIDEHNEILKLYASALDVTNGIGRLTEAVRKASPEAEDLPKVEDAQMFEERCRSEVSKGHPLLVAHSAVALWSALESTIPEFVKQFVKANPQVLDRPQFQKLKISAAEALKLSPEELVAFVVEELERATQSQVKWGVGRFDELVSALGVSPVIDSTVRRDIFELSQVRNVIAHNRSVVDRKLVESCPWLDLRVGEPLRLTMADHHKYSAAVCRYAADILEAS